MNKPNGPTIKAALSNPSGMVSIYHYDAATQTQVNIGPRDILAYIEELERRVMVLAFAVADKQEKAQT